MYDALTIFAWIVMAVLFLVLVLLVVFLGSWPGKIAARRNHPQADAINAASWIGLLLCGAGWPIAFVWAHLNRGPLGSGDIEEDLQAENQRLRKKLTELEAQQKATG